MALKFGASYAGISGDLKDTDNRFPPLDKTSFSESVADVSCLYELHFWGYGTGTATYKGHKRWVPYIQLGKGYLTNFVFCVVGAMAVLWIWNRLFG